jgi:hypothetical protein
LPISWAARSVASGWFAASAMPVCSCCLPVLLFRPLLAYLLIVPVLVACLFLSVQACGLLVACLLFACSLLGLPLACLFSACSCAYCMRVRACCLPVRVCCLSVLAYCLLVLTCCLLVACILSGSLLVLACGSLLPSVLLISTDVITICTSLKFMNES